MALMKPRVLRIEQLEDRSVPSANVVLHWNEILLQSLVSQPPRVPLARNLALVHVAMFDAVNAIDRSYVPYAAHVHASLGASLESAAAQAAHDTLVALYPSRQAVYDAALAEDLAGIAPGRARQGVAIGQEVARQILALRANDGASAIMTYTPPNNDPGTYQLTPPNFAPAANVHVPFITPFAVESSFQFRPGPYPALDSPEYAADFNEVKLVGASDADTADRDGNVLPDRTADQTLVAELWRLPLTNHQVWNRIAQDQAAAHHLSLPDTARLFALLDMAINDGLQTSNESKYHYVLWRPITAIQRADEDGNPDTEAEATWMTEHPTTPAYPSYASNASAIGAASATVLAEVFGANDIPFQVNWAAYTSQGGPRSYAGFWAAADEMANSRIYGGIHFRFDCVAGQQIGRDVGGYVLANFLTPRNQGDDDEAAAGVIRLDDNAAGWGWFVGRTPRNDSEFTPRGNQGERNCIGPVTVLTQDVGHVLGYNHGAGGVMQETVNAGTRQTTGPATATDGLGAPPTLIAWTAETPWIDGFVSASEERR
jgi:hypothetical protein